MLLNPNSRPFTDGNRRIADGFFFDIDKCIGRGATSAVFFGNLIGERNQLGRKVAVKVIDAKEASLRNACEEEMNMLMRLRGEPHIVQLLGSFYDESCREYLFAMELGRSVKDLLYGDIKYLHGLSKELLIDLIQDLVSAVGALHGKSIAHRDIKPDNVLFFSNQSHRRNRKSTVWYKLCDFGCSKEGPYGKTITGTIGYINPKIIKRYLGPDDGNSIDKRYGAVEVDLWSLGCTIVECATAQRTFPTSPEEIYQKCVVDIPTGSNYICASMDCESKQIVYGDHIKNDSYPMYFRHVLKEMVLLMFYRPNLQTLEEMVHALVSAKESNFIVLTYSPYSVVYKNYAFFSSGLEKNYGYPSLKDELNIPQELQSSTVMSSERIGSFDSFEFAGNKTYVICFDKSQTQEQQQDIHRNEIQDTRLASLVLAVKHEDKCNSMKRSIKESLQVLEKNMENLIYSYGRAGGLYNLLVMMNNTHFAEVSAVLREENLVWNSVLIAISSESESENYLTKFDQQIIMYSEAVMKFTKDNLESEDFQEDTQVYENSYELMRQKNNETYVQEILQGCMKKYNSTEMRTFLLLGQTGLLYHLKILRWLHELVDQLQATIIGSSHSLTQNASVIRELLTTNQLTVSDSEIAAMQVLEGDEEGQRNCTLRIHENLQELQSLLEENLDSLVLSL